jgi:hypothetical protein
MYMSLLLQNVVLSLALYVQCEMNIQQGRFYSSIPMKWVEAVLLELRSMIGDKKLLALSVVGLQSSGKSTLLKYAGCFTIHYFKWMSYEQ